MIGDLIIPRAVKPLNSGIISLMSPTHGGRRTFQANSYKDFVGIP